MSLRLESNNPHTLRAVSKELVIIIYGNPIEKLLNFRHVANIVVYNQRGGLQILSVEGKCYLSDSW